MIKHLINGQQVESAETFQTLNPATGEVIDTVASGGQEEINAAVAAAKAPVVLVIAARKDVIFPGITDIDCAIATENLWLELEELGLGGVMMAVAPVPERMEAVGKILNLPDNQYAFALLPFGYPVGKKPQVDRYDAKKIHWVE